MHLFGAGGGKSRGESCDIVPANGAARMAPNREDVRMNAPVSGFEEFENKVGAARQ